MCIVKNSLTLRRSTLSPSHLPSLFCQQIPAAVCFPRLSSWLRVLSSRPSFYVRHSLSRVGSRVERERVSPRLAPSTSQRTPFMNSPLSPFSLFPSPPRLAHVVAPHRPTLILSAAGTAPALSRPLTPCASSFAQSISPAFAGLAQSRANAIGGARLDSDSVRNSSCVPTFPFILLHCLHLLLSPFRALSMPPPRLMRLRYYSPTPYDTTLVDLG